MFRNYFKIAWRNLVKNKIYSIINVIGLAAGMVMAPWLEKLYRRATKRPQGGEDE